MVAPPTGTVTFLFTDIEGSSRMWEKSPQRDLVVAGECGAHLHSAIGANGGYVFKTVGDAFYAAFPTAPEALEVALCAQRALLAEEWPREVGQLRVRMALHTGATEARGGDYFGPPLNRVARLLSAAQGVRSCSRWRPKNWFGTSCRSEPSSGIWVSTGSRT